MLLIECRVFENEVRMMCWCCWVSVMCLCMKWGWCADVVEWVSCVWVWSEDDVMMLLSECHVFVNEVRMMWWSCWVSVMCLCMKLGWCADVVEWVSCVWVWCEDDKMMCMSECHAFVYEVRMMCWCCWVSVMCLCIKWGWSDEVVDWVLCFCLWREDYVMRLLSECHVFVYEVRMMWWCCWLSVVSLLMKWG